jgi:disulfide oxidoreductase YuzD
MINASEAKARSLAASPTFKHDMDVIEAAIKSATDKGEFEVYVTDICDNNRDVYVKELKDIGYSPYYSGCSGMTIKWP